MKKSLRIKNVFFDDLERVLRLAVEEKGKKSKEVLIGFRKDIYFDLVIAVGTYQRKNREAVKRNKIQEILNWVKQKREVFSLSRRKEYGEIRSIRSFETLWREYLQNKGGREYSILKSADRGLVSRFPEILSALFQYKGSGESFECWLGAEDPGYIRVPDSFLRTFEPSPLLYHRIGSQEIHWIPLIVDLDEGFGPDDIKITFRRERVPLPEELRDERKKIFDEYEQAKIRGEEYPWPGLIYGIESFSELPRNLATEKPMIHLVLTPTDYFTLLAVQRCLDETQKKFIFRDEYGRPQSLRERYLSHIDPFKINPICCHSVSGTVTLICKDKKGDEYAILAQRSDREMLITGRDVYVISINETPKRKPFSEEEKKLIEGIPEEKIAPDPDDDALLFHAVARGAREELGINLPEEKIRFLAFGMEPDRYMYGIVGIAETDAELDYILSLEHTARDRKLEYKGIESVKFTPQEVYDFMVTHRAWGPEAEIGLYYALIYKFGRDPVANLFKDYPAPRIPPSI